MDSSISKALIMVAGVLVAMIVIGLITMSFNTFSQWASTQDDEVVIEQTQKFNKEYEAYDKDLMYGVDVISCLNKVKSNNDAILGKYSEQLDANYAIEATVKLNDSKLDETLIVYHITSTGNGKQEEYPQNAGPSKNAKTLKDLGFSFLNTSYSSLSSRFKASTVIKTDHTTGTVDLKTDNLVLNASTTNTDVVIKLLSASNAMSQIIKNTDSASKNDYNGWTAVEFRTGLYYLKTKKFKCTNISYNPKTGRVNKIDFEEM